MNEKTSALYSEYVIDGVPQELTPARILDACMAEDAARTEAPGSFEPIVDETVDPAPKPCATDPAKIGEYIRLVKGLRTWVFPSAFPETYTKCRIACALIDAIWRRGHFRLCDLALRLEWNWSPQRIGDMAAFYASVSSAADYVDSLGLKLSGYSYTEGESGCDVAAVPSLAAVRPGDDDAALAGEPEFFAELPFRTGHPQLKAQNFHPSKLLPDAGSWLIYVPFEDCEYRLGASLLAQALGSSGAMAPQIVDPDYFIDCYEVVRELVEDGVVLSGVTVGRGGLISALKRMTGPKIGATVELADLVRATGDRDIVRLLFAEVPGVLFQIADIDYDYVDAELLLQDIAFYPLGHPVPGRPGVDIISSDKPGIQTILESLIRSQSSEGED